jgi:ABC-type bacteriocin/lantibiotic exporter with double-glycine peptidase domain
MFSQADWVKEECRPSQYWPQNGEVTFSDYGTRYREGLDLVLKGINCSIQGGEKVGVAF